MQVGLTQRHASGSRNAPDWQDNQAAARERRDSDREAARDLCEILIEHSRIAIPCLAHNISRNGALLETNALDLPQRFILANHTRRIRTVCKIAWQKGRMIGVRFMTAPRPFGQDA
jgi:hypothetical protein